MKLIKPAEIPLREILDIKSIPTSYSNHNKTIPGIEYHIFNRINNKEGIATIYFILPTDLEEERIHYHISIL